MKKIIMDKKILITGARGFIGKNLCEHFASKYQLLIPDHQTLDLLDTEKVYSYLSKNKPDVVIHSAFIGGARNFNGVNEYLHHKAKESIIKPNIRMLINLLKGQNFFKRMIIFGSGAEYDKSRNLKKVKESDFNKVIPNDEYGFSKYLCSLITQSQLNVYCLRPFGVFGKYEDYEVRFISNIILKYLLKLPLTITQNAYFDYLDVYDLARIIDYFICHKPKHKFYNIGRGRKRSLVNIAQKINKLGAYSLPIVIKKKGWNKEYSCDNSRLIKEIAGFKFTCFNQSLRNLYQWYKANMNKIDKKKITDDKYN